MEQQLLQLVQWLQQKVVTLKLKTLKKYRNVYVSTLEVLIREDLQYPALYLTACGQIRSADIIESHELGSRRSLSTRESNFISPNTVLRIIPSTEFLHEKLWSNLVLGGGAVCYELRDELFHRMSRHSRTRYIKCSKHITQTYFKSWG